MSEKPHICQNDFLGVGDMRGAYDRAGLIPTSINADVFLIRSHIAYWSGAKEAEKVEILSSRGRSYRVNGARSALVRVIATYDHRDGVIGWK